MSYDICLEISLGKRNGRYYCHTIIEMVKRMENIKDETEFKELITKITIDNYADSMKSGDTSDMSAESAVDLNIVSNIASDIILRTGLYNCHSDLIRSIQESFGGSMRADYLNNNEQEI